MAITTYEELRKVFRAAVATNSRMRLVYGKPYSSYLANRLLHRADAAVDLMELGIPVRYALQASFGRYRKPANACLHAYRNVRILPQKDSTEVLPATTPDHAN